MVLVLSSGFFGSQISPNFFQRATSLEFFREQHVVRCCRLPQLRCAGQGRVDNLRAWNGSCQRFSGLWSASDLARAQQHCYWGNRWIWAWVGRPATWGCGQADADVRAVQPQTDFCCKEQFLASSCYFHLGRPVGFPAKSLNPVNH